MITLRTEQFVSDLTAQAAYDFLAAFDEAQYRSWMPGEHLRVVVYHRTPNHVGSTYYLDQVIGGIRVRATEKIVEAVPGRRLLRQVLWCGFQAPVRMQFEFEPQRGGVLIKHAVTAGFTGVGRILDPLFRFCFFTKRFAAALDQHMKDELLALRELIAERAPLRAATPVALPMPPLPVGTFAHF
jgi:hypothetical protein